MLTETTIVLTTSQRFEFLGRFEALEYIEKKSQIQNVRAKNKTPIMILESSDSKVEDLSKNYKVIEVPKEIIGDIEKFTEFCHENQFECGDYLTGELYDTSLQRCIFCEITNYKGFEDLVKYNQFVDKPVDCIIYESTNFYVIPEKGALKQGFVMIIPKKHYYSVAQFPKEIIPEYKEVCKDIECILLKAFKGKVITFMEHGSNSFMATSPDSTVHCHTHVVSDFVMKAKYKKMVQLEPCDDISQITEGRYFSYQEGATGQLYATLNRDVYIQHQYGRQVLASQLNYPPGHYNWRNYIFRENVDSTLFHLYESLKEETEGRIFERTRGFVEGFGKRAK